MENSELSLQAPPPALSGAAPGASTEQPARNPFGEGAPIGPGRDSRRGGLRGRLGSAVAAIVALVVKFFAAIKGALLFLPKLKLLTTGGTALVSVAAYSLWFGWTFAIGFVILLFVHEMGHVLQLRREGVKASAPMFIPFFGAVVMMRSMPKDALAEARVGLAGPILGTAGSAVCLGVAEATNSDFFRALAYIGFFLNLINLIPVTPFDGGRAMAAMAPAMWFVGLAVLAALVVLTNNLFLVLFLLIGGMDTWSRWKHRKTRSLEQAAYYRIPTRSRLLVGLVYVGLIVLLALGMDAAQILSSGTHSFSSV